MKTLLLILALAFPVVAQTETATIYIYQTPHARMLKRAAPEVFCDGTLLAELDGGRYMVVNVAPGERTFHSKNKKNGGVLINVEAGKTYYLRVQMEHTGYFLKFSGISLVQPEEGSFTVKQLRAIPKKYVKDKQVDLSHTEEAMKAATGA